MILEKDVAGDGAGVVDEAEEVNGEAVVALTGLGNGNMNDTVAVTRRKCAWQKPLTRNTELLCLIVCYAQFPKIRVG